MGLDQMPRDDDVPSGDFTWDFGGEVSIWEDPSDEKPVRVLDASMFQCQAVSKARDISVLLHFHHNLVPEREVVGILIERKEGDFNLIFPLIQLLKPVPVTAEYGYCTDVMEHIPPEHVDQVLLNILRSAQHVFFQIDCQEDVCGKLIGEQLHLSVHPYSWWLKKFTELGCYVHWSQDNIHNCLFYVTAWQAGEEIVKVGVLNVEESQVIENVKDFLISGLSFDPEIGDSVSDGSFVWDVGAPNNEPSWRWTNGSRLCRRIHTKLNRAV